MKKFLEFIKGIILEPQTSNPTDNEPGSLWYNSTDDEFKGYADGAVRTILTEDQVQSVSNKSLDNSNDITVHADNLTIQDPTDATKQARLDVSSISTATTRTFILPDANDTIAGIDSTQTLANKTLTNPVINGPISGTSILDDNSFATASSTTVPTSESVKVYVDAQVASKDEASEIGYSNVTSGLVATDVQAAIDEVEGRLDTAESDISTLQTNLATVTATADGAEDDIFNHINEITGAHSASAISYSNATSGLVATQTQAAIDEVEGRLDTAESDITTLETALPAGDDYLQLEELASAPSSPSAGVKRLYAKNDGKVYTKNSAGVEQEVGSGSGGGSGGKNYIGNGDFEADAAGVSTYDDTGAYVDGTGGSPTVITAARSTSGPLAGVGSLLISKSAANGSGEGISIAPETIDSEDLGSKLYINFSYDATSANYVSGDIKLKAYDVTNSVELSVAPFSNLDEDCGLFKVKAKATAVVYPSNTTAQIRLSLHLESDSATAAAWDIKLDSVQLQPDTPIPTAIVADLGQQTWTDNQANATTSVRVSRVGNKVSIDGKMSITGALSGATTITIPGAFTADTGPYTSIGSGVFPVVGRVGFIDGTSFNSVGLLVLTNINELTILPETASGSYVSIANTSDTVPFTWASSDSMTLKAEWIVSGWSTGNIMSTHEVAVSTAKVMATTAAGQSILNSGSVVVFGTEVEDNLNAYNPSTGVFTCPKDGTYKVTASLSYASADFTTGAKSIQFYKNGALYSYALDYPSTGYTGSFAQNASRNVPCLAGDTLSIVANANEAAARSLSPDAFVNWLTIEELPDFSIFGVVGVNKQEVLLSNADGHGSTNNKVRRWSSASVSGLSMSYSDSAANGMSVVINNPGIYAIDYLDFQSAGTPVFGITRNSANLTTAIGSITLADGKLISTRAIANGVSTPVSATVWLNRGDIIRAHTDGNPDGTGADVTFFRITQVGQ